jgi:hypothetical protein
MYDVSTVADHLQWLTYLKVAMIIGLGGNAELSTLDWTYVPNVYILYSCPTSIWQRKWVLTLGSASTYLR